MTQEEKLDKINKDFSLLPAEKQDYILAVVQALAFAHDMANKEAASFDSIQNTELKCAVT